MTTSTETPKPLTNHNLERLKWSTDGTSTTAPRSGDSKCLSSGESNTRLPMDYRIDHAKQVVRYYMERVIAIEPEGAQVIQESEVQLSRKGYVRLKNNVPRDHICFKNKEEETVPWSKLRGEDCKVPGSWKDQIDYFKTQLTIRAQKGEIRNAATHTYHIGSSCTISRGEAACTVACNTAKDTDVGL